MDLVVVVAEGVGAGRSRSDVLAKSGRASPASAASEGESEFPTAACGLRKCKNKEHETHALGCTRGRTWKQMYRNYCEEPRISMASSKKRRARARRDSLRKRQTDPLQDSTVERWTEQGLS